MVTLIMHHYRRHRMAEEVMGNLTADFNPVHISFTRALTIKKPRTIISLCINVYSSCSTQKI